MATTQQQLTPQQLALYLGQMAKTPAGIVCISSVSDLGFATDVDRVRFPIYNWFPILRRLDSITEDEARALYTCRYPLESWEGESALNDWWLESDEFYIPERLNCLGCPSAWLYLLSLGIDLFGWIDAGLAIDKATLQEK